jgi:hypothetical protein
MQWFGEGQTSKEEDSKSPGVAFIKINFECFLFLEHAFNLLGGVVEWLGLAIFLEELVIFQMFVMSSQMAPHCFEFSFWSDEEGFWIDFIVDSKFFEGGVGGADGIDEVPDL